ncbi:3-dehydroquinate synthase [Paenibacillus agilis]|uniref:3-dehydroquinate synthase n=1 Tax=Paenibacillus agilis TaxID=3020863 RepID=A0A559IZ57_9BACL|nr:3-dehydroquinate synthase [Paenibacillus agilis]TVX92893.1 3-dehydroquinate synthase [Paenibacillus agilis]
MDTNQSLGCRELIVSLEDRSYPIWIGSGLLPRLSALLLERGISNGSPLLLVSDEQVAKHHLATVQQALQEGGYNTVVHIVPSGESSKSLTHYEACMTTAIEAGLDRKSTVLALGGGVVGDLAGFVAATYMRGVKFIQLPTTILAHDSSVGGKVAVNHALAKNMIGAFHQPEAVIFDLETLHTLPIREVRAGLAEMIKHGLIWDEAFSDWCLEHADDLVALDQAKLAYGIYMGCNVKAQVVSKDEREQNLRAILNLGHTIGHALEAVGQYGELLHGEAISIGMVGSAELAVLLGEDSQLVTYTRRILEAFGLPTSIPSHYDTDAILSAMMHDKKFSGGRTTFVIPTAVGQVDIRHDISIELVRSVVDKLKGESA